MSTEVVMPQMGESIAEGTIIKWHKKLGDVVSRDETLFEITTDKVDSEVPSPIEGILKNILVKENETVSVGTVVAILDNSSMADTNVTHSDTIVEEPSQETSTISEQEHFQSTHEPIIFQRHSVPEQEPVRQSNEIPSHSAISSTDEDRSRNLSPAVSTLVSKHNLPMDELFAINGTGRGGRITKQDLLSHLSNRPLTPAKQMETISSPLQKTPNESTLMSPPQQYIYQPESDDELVPIGDMGQHIADHMLWSQQISAQVTSFTECDLHRIVHYKDEENDQFEQSYGIPLTFTPFVAEATVRALKEFPILNSSIVGQQIALKKHVHLGIAVAVEKGFVAPVIHNADEINFTGLARAIQTMSEKAQRSNLTPEDVQGATFTITNPGMFGGLTGTPIISQPQVAMLSLGTIQKKPAVVEDSIAIRPIIVLALTFDHRIIDGATGYQFLELIRNQLENAELPKV